jgi:hypothetical protein
VCELTETDISYFLRLLPQSGQALFVCWLYGVLLFDGVIAKDVPVRSLKSVALWVSQAAAALVVVAALISCDKKRLVSESVRPSYILWEVSKEMEKEQQTAYLVSCPPLDEINGDREWGPAGIGRYCRTRSGVE